MRRPGFEPGFWAWKAQVIATRPSTRTATHLEVFVIYNLFALIVAPPEFYEFRSDHRKSKIFGSCDVIATVTLSFLAALERTN